MMIKLFFITLLCVTLVFTDSPGFKDSQDLRETMMVSGFTGMADHNMGQASLVKRSPYDEGEQEQEQGQHSHGGPPPPPGGPPPHGGPPPPGGPPPHGGPPSNGGSPGEESTDDQKSSDSNN